MKIPKPGDTVIRKAPEDRKNGGYAMINTNILTDPNLSKNAKLLHCYAMSRPNNWRFVASNIARDLFNSEDREAVRDALNELVCSGYAVGSFKEGNVMFFELHLNQIMKSDFDIRSHYEELTKNARHNRSYSSTTK